MQLDLQMAGLLLGAQMCLTPGSSLGGFLLSHWVGLWEDRTVPGLQLERSGAKLQDHFRDEVSWTHLHGHRWVYLFPSPCVGKPFPGPQLGGAGAELQEHFTICSCTYIGRPTSGGTDECFFCWIPGPTRLLLKHG